MTRQINNIEGEIIKQGPKTALVDVQPISLLDAEILGCFENCPGQYVLLPKGVKIINCIRTLLKKYIQNELCFDEVILPKIAQLETFEKAGLIGKWDDYLFAVTPLSTTNGVKDQYLLDPLQCTALYHFYENRFIDVSNSPIRWFDCSGPTYRNEDIAKLDACIKQMEFHRAEFMYIGTMAQVIETRERCLEQLEKLCINIGFNYRIVVGSGCYQLDDSLSSISCAAHDIPIKDLEIYIPTRDLWLEVAGSAVLGTTITKRFNIQSTDFKDLWSGCTGIGLDRLLYCLVNYNWTELDKLAIG